ncbi:hypothetical protein Osc1_15820 [Hominimerdicola sp. 21CYCFAH17_S]
MSCTVDTVFNFKGIKCVKLESRKYFAVVSPEIGSSVLRFFDKENGIEIFRYREDCTIADINKAREIWGLPTLYLPNRFDGGIIRTSDAIYKLPINEKKLGNFLHGWVHKRTHKVEQAFTDCGKAVLKTSYTFGAEDEMYSFFPVDFKISYTFTLSDERGLEQEIYLENKSKKRLPVSLCTHTCLNAPMTKGGSEEAMRLCVPVGQKCELDERCLPTEKLLPLSDWDIEYKKGLKRPTLQVISNDMYTAAMNTLDGKDFYGTVVTDTATGHKLCNEVSEEFKFWNMWNHDGDKGYFCPEPMTAMINSPNLSLPEEVSGYTELAEGEKFTCRQRFFTRLN